ncbi:hypothetical protein DFH07DRAFT_783937 [Mycena maculata]|uniref:Uncharacterized protein n=1 Tax=Mycena maculata TaxID=230809 RepID=A0AAD7ML36_9AGAR|nr:hypothetical protein DFH07DRAFT_783937 [Mycena maculata]
MTVVDEIEEDENLARVNDTKGRDIPVLLEELGEVIDQYGEPHAEVLQEFSREQFPDHHGTLPNQQRPTTEYYRRVDTEVHATITASLNHRVKEKFTKVFSKIAEQHMEEINSGSGGWN